MSLVALFIAGLGTPAYANEHADPASRGDEAADVAPVDEVRALRDRAEYLYLSSLYLGDRRASACLAPKLVVLDALEAGLARADAVRLVLVKARAVAVGVEQCTLPPLEPASDQDIPLIWPEERFPLVESVCSCA